MFCFKSSLQIVILLHLKTKGTKTDFMWPYLRTHPVCWWGHLWWLDLSSQQQLSVYQTMWSSPHPRTCEATLCMLGVDDQGWFCVRPPIQGFPKDQEVDACKYKLKFKYRFQVLVSSRYLSYYMWYYIWSFSWLVNRMSIKTPHVQRSSKSFRIHHDISYTTEQKLV